jgi:hypothetical protein
MDSRTIAASLVRIETRPDNPTVEPDQYLVSVCGVLVATWNSHNNAEDHARLKVDALAAQLEPLLVQVRREAIEQLARQAMAEPPIESARLDWIRQVHADTTPGDTWSHKAAQAVIGALLAYIDHLHATIAWLANERA